MRLGAVVYSSSPAAAEIPQWLYMGSRETSVCRLRRVSSVVGRGANQSCGMVPVVGDGSASSEVGESDYMESPVVMGCTHVSTMPNIRSKALWRANNRYNRYYRIDRLYVSMHVRTFTGVIYVV